MTELYKRRKKRKKKDCWELILLFCLQSCILGCPRIYITTYGICRVNIYDPLISLASCQALGSMHHHDCFGLNIPENNHSELLSPKLEGIKMGSLWEMTRSTRVSERGLVHLSNGCKEFAFLRPALHRTKTQDRQWGPHRTKSTGTLFSVSNF